jgi:hypothetical protein
MGDPSSLSTVLIYKRGWRYVQPMQVAGIIAASAINTPGRLSLLVPVRDQPLTGVDWLGRWVWWEHPTQGIFAGYVEDAPIDTGRGTVELGVISFVNILTKRRTIRRYRPAAGPPGAIVRRALADVTLDAGMPFEITASERGNNLTYEFRAASIMDVFDAMVSASGQEWRSWMDDSRTLQIEWRPKVGEDLTADVTFTEGVNIIDARIEQTIANTVNDLLGIADDQQYDRAQGARFISAGSRGRFGSLQDTRRYTGLVSKSTLMPQVQSDLETLALPTVTITIRVYHLEPLLSLIRDGSEFRFVSHSANAVYRARVLARDIDLDSGVVTLTCDAVSDITRATQLDSWRYGGISTAAG